MLTAKVSMGRMVPLGDMSASPATQLKHDGTSTKNSADAAVSGRLGSAEPEHVGSAEEDQRRSSAVVENPLSGERITIRRDTGLTDLGRSIEGPFTMLERWGQTNWSHVGAARRGWDCRRNA